MRFLKLPAILEEEEGDHDGDSFIIWLNPFQIESIGENLPEHEQYTCRVLTKAGVSYLIMMSAEDLIAEIERFIK